VSSPCRRAAFSSFFPFPTTIHKYAQPFPPISIDAPNHIHYLPHQIEPGSLKLYGSVSRAQQLNGGCGREIEPRGRKVLRLQFKRGATTLTGSCALDFLMWRPLSEAGSVVLLHSLFPTPIHTFAQPFPPISIDAPNHIHYLPHQIEPKSLKLHGSVSKAQQLNGGCGRGIEPTSRKVLRLNLIGRISLAADAPLFFSA
jgi:hypothetical protein